MKSRPFGKSFQNTLFIFQVFDNDFCFNNAYNPKAQEHFQWQLFIIRKHLNRIYGRRGCVLIGAKRSNVCSAAARTMDSLLDGKRAEDLKVAQLKYWLSFKGKSTRGKKADLDAR